METDLHELVVTGLQAAGKDRWETIALETGVSKHTIIKIARRIIVSPRYQTLQPLARYFQSQGVETPKAAA